MFGQSLAVFKWKYEQHLYTHTLIPIINRFAGTNEPLNTILFSTSHITWQHEGCIYYMFLLSCFCIISKFQIPKMHKNPYKHRFIADDVLSINNPEFENYLGQMYPVELEIKDTTESNTSASYLDLLLSVWGDGQLHTSIYDKRDDFNFHITNFPFLSSNIPTSPTYGVFISQPIRYARACSSYGCFILRATRLSNKLLEQGYVKNA